MISLTAACGVSTGVLSCFMTPAVFLWARVSAVKVAGAGGQSGENGRQYLLEEEQRGEDEASHRAISSGAGCRWLTEWSAADLAQRGRAHAGHRRGRNLVPADQVPL